MWLDHSLTLPTGHCWESARHLQAILVKDLLLIPACGNADGQVELREDLVGSCVVGDVITVLGLVKVLATGDPKPAGVGAGCAPSMHRSLWALPVSRDPFCSLSGAMWPPAHQYFRQHREHPAEQ